MTYNAKRALAEHRARYGRVYRLPGGKFVRIKDEDLPGFLRDNGYILKQPNQQPTLEQLKDNINYL